MTGAHVTAAILREENLGADIDPGQGAISPREWGEEIPFRGRISANIRGRPARRRWAERRPEIGAPHAAGARGFARRRGGAYNLAP